jgi:hypothetical protein
MLLVLFSLMVPVRAQYKSPGELKGASVKSVTESTRKIEYKYLQSEVERDKIAD